MRLRISIRGFVRPSVRPFVRRSVDHAVFLNADIAQKCSENIMQLTRLGSTHLFIRSFIHSYTQTHRCLARTFGVFLLHKLKTRILDFESVIALNFSSIQMEAVMMYVDDDVILLNINLL